MNDEMNKEREEDVLAEENKKLEGDILEEEDLEKAAGGKKKAEPSNLLYKATKKPKTTNTLYSGQSKEASNLLQTDENGTDRNRRNSF